MNNAKYRKHPRVYEKKQTENKQLDENTIQLSGLAAFGILAGIFIKGVFWGYVLRKSMD